ncbi:unnamed protein product [Auanema sp. JU1783]|nr:unnamed protein product [Auanema sp. JU1783]
MVWWRLGPCKKISICSKPIFRLLHTSRVLCNHYNVLGVKQNATQREIKAAYYKLSKKFHPDVAGNNDSTTKKFHEITEAYECLRDPDRRRAYDNQTTGSGGRYTGDYRYDPFANFNNRNQSYQNPFHSQQFTQQEFERVFREFNRIKKEMNMNQDQRMEFERQRMRMEFQRNRAERWKQFHQRYADGPPGSIKFGWRSSAGNQERIYNAWELIRKIMMVYFLIFFMISLVKVFLKSMGDIKNPSGAVPLSNEEQMRQFMEKVPTNDREKIVNLMNQMPSSSQENESKKMTADNDFQLYNNTRPDSMSFNSGYSAYQGDQYPVGDKRGSF